MPRIEVVFFRETDESVPLLGWLNSLVGKARARCIVRLGRLSTLGHELRRPESDYLEDGIYELRAIHAGINYRMLYFFHGVTAIVVTHGFTKQRAALPSREMHVALARKKKYETHPEGHTFRSEAQP